MKTPNKLSKLSVFVGILVLTLSFTLAITETGNYENTIELGNGNVQTCQEQWSCSWSACIDNSQTYVCTDLNDCGTNNLEPELSGAMQECEIVTPPLGRRGGGSFSGTGHSNITTTTASSSSSSSGSCQEDWVCQQWSNLEGECGTRTCEDQNSCGTFQLKPFTYKDCERTRALGFTGAVTGITEKILTTPGIYIPLIFVFLIAAGGLSVLLFAGRKKNR